MRGLVLLLLLLLTPLGSNMCAKLLEGPGVTYAWGGHPWLAVPIALALFGSRRLQPKADPVISFARGLAFLSALYAVWALAAFPGEFRAVWQKLPSRQAFYENVALVPSLAVFGAASLLMIHKTVKAGEDPHARRAWLVARSQLVVAICVLLAQLWFVNQATCPYCGDFRPHILAVVLVSLIGIEGGIRFR